MGELRLVVPPGIGDTSWVYSKVCELGKSRQIVFEACHDPPRRDDPYMRLLPNVACAGYSGHSYRDACKRLLPVNTDLAVLPDGEYFIGVNEHLEAGKRLEAAFPAQPTTFHYKLKLPLAESLSAVQWLRGEPRKKLGIYCSSFAHRSEAGFWAVPQWVEFCNLVMRSPGLEKVVWVAVGAPYDDRTLQVCQTLRAQNLTVLPCLNQPPGETFRIMQELDYFFAFPSGLGIMGDVLDVPTFMWFWGNLPRFAHMRGLFNGYADPANVASGRHINAPYALPAESHKLFMEKGLAHVGKRPPVGFSDA